MLSSEGDRSSSGVLVIGEAGDVALDGSGAGESDDELFIFSITPFNIKVFQISSRRCRLLNSFSFSSILNKGTLKQNDEPLRALCLCLQFLFTLTFVVCLKSKTTTFFVFAFGAIFFFFLNLLMLL